MGIGIGAAIYQHLAATTAVTTYTSSRIFPSIVPQGITGTRIVIYRISDPPVHAMSVDPELHSPRYQVSVFDSDYDNGKAAADAIKDALRDYQTSISGLLGDGTSGVDVQRIFYDGGPELADLDPMTGEIVYHFPQDFIIWHST